MIFTVSTYICITDGSLNFKALPLNMSQNIPLSRWGGMWVTSHHPVLVGNEWVYPADLGPATPFSSVADQVSVLTRRHRYIVLPWRHFFAHADIDVSRIHTHF